MNWFRRRALRNAFGAFMSEEALRTLERDEVSMPPLAKAKLCHVLLHVRDDSADTLSANVADAIERLAREGAMIDSVLSSLISAVFLMNPTTGLDEVAGHLASSGRTSGPSIRSVSIRADYSDRTPALRMALSSRIWGRRWSGCCTLSSGRSHSLAMRTRTDCQAEGPNDEPRVSARVHLS
ncbi:hypothetical protein [Bradyrhizobium sp. STM 3809]|uniref:hypothetical protein n=1 Tax=Bradyrhizobium sp. STM 3809 TaxID=551936 RepID=UPI00024081DC|nr:hypothetical protein [Bradyrhizobium sp. STM 3809]CCE03061.1 hypothetical protein BRAS3809_6900010 [Bradyrhizobium sp. STM 3809]